MKRMARSFAMPAVVLACLGGTAVAAGYRGYDQAIPAIGGGETNARNVEIIENLGQTVPTGLEFVDADGGKVTVADVLGRDKPVLVTMGYFRCPMLCDLVHQGLAKSLQKAKLELGKDYLALAVSIDPKDNPKSAKTNRARLLRHLGAAGEGAAAWPFVMDPPEAVQSPSKALADKIGFRYYYDKESDQFAHSAAVFVLTPEGKISRYLYGVDFDPRDLRFALVEAGGGRVGTTLDRVLLTCFKYDPMVQKYTPYVAGFIRLGAGLSGVALFVLLGMLWRKELQMRRQRRTA